MHAGFCRAAWISRIVTLASMKAVTSIYAIRCCLAGEEEHQVPGTAAPGPVIKGDIRVGPRLDCRIRRGLRCGRLGEGAGLVLAGRAEDQVLPAQDYGMALAARRQIDAYQPSGVPGCSGLARRPSPETAVSKAGHDELE